MNQIARSRGLGFSLGNMKFVDGSTRSVNGLVELLRGNIVGSEYWSTFVAEVKASRGTSLVSAVAVQPIDKGNGILDLELTFLATKESYEGCGVSSWLCYKMLDIFRSLKFDTIWVQSCDF